MMGKRPESNPFARGNSRPTLETTSELLRRVLDTLPEPSVEAGEVVEALRGRSYGALFILLAILSMVPGVSSVAALAMYVPALQLARGRPFPVLPTFLTQRRIDSAGLRRLGGRFLVWIASVERLVKPRWPALAAPPWPNLAGLLICAMASVVILPLPFSNFPSAIALTFLSLGFLERDGAMILIGLVCSLLALAVGVVIVVAAWEGGAWLMGTGFG